MSENTTNKGARIKRSFMQSDYITAGWNWFMVLAGKAAEPVLVMSVLYASVKLLPVVHFPPQADVVVFIAQFVALDIGGLSLNKLADQAKKDGNDEGAKHARRLSIALVAIMLAGVIMAGVDQIVKLDGQLGTVIDTMLLIARAVLAVLYSRVIHSLKNDDEPEPPTQERVEELITEAVNTSLTAAIENVRQEIVSQLGATLSQHLDQRLAELDMRQTETMAHLRDEQAALIAETVTSMIETAVRKRVPVSPPAVSSPKVRSITEATSRKRAPAGTGKQEIDKVIWPLLDTGLSVRTIAAQTTISAGTVGRSRKRWIATQGVSAADIETPEQAETAESVI
jgi:hypothetical protein